MRGRHFLQCRMSKLKIIGALVVSTVIGMLLAFYFCANDIYNPFHNVFKKGSGHGVLSHTDVLYIQKHDTIPSVFVREIKGKTIYIPTQATQDQKTTIPTISVSPCPETAPFLIDDTIPWQTYDVVKLPNDSSVHHSDSGFYFVKFTVFPDYRSIKDFSFSGTPLHPIYYSTTERIIINPEAKIDYFAGVGYRLNQPTLTIAAGARLPGQLLPLIHPKQISIDANAEFFFDYKFTAAVHLYYHF